MKNEDMMHYKTFDTHKHIKSLQETGFNEKQAEKLVKSLLESRDFNISILATREQLTKVEAKLQKEIANVKTNILKWMLPFMLSSFTMIVAIMIKLFLF